LWEGGVVEKVGGGGAMEHRMEGRETFSVKEVRKEECIKDCNSSEKRGLQIGVEALTV